MALFLLLCALLAPAALAQSPFEIAEVGVISPGGSTPEVNQVFKQAGRSPLASSALNFSRLNDNELQTWGWRVNISEVPVPNQIQDLGMPSADFSEKQRVVNIQWQLEWPGNPNQTLESWLGANDLNMRVNAIISDKPSSITSGYDKTDHGDCTSILGDTCVQSLSEAAASRYSGDGLSGCANTLDVETGTGFHAGIGFGIAGTTNNSSPSSFLYRGDTLFYATTETFMVGNDILLKRAKGALQILIIDIRSIAQQHGAMGRPSILCQIIDKDADLEAGHSGSANGDSSTDGDTSGAADCRYLASLFWTLTIVSVVFLSF